VLATLLTRSVYSTGETITGALADLDGLGSHPHPAHGLAPTADGLRPWSGVVDVNLLRRWHESRRTEQSGQRQLQHELRAALR
jgi:hypothetical protein